MATSKTPSSKAKTAHPRKPRAKKAAARPTGAPIEVSDEERWRMIAVAAYHKAQTRSFTPGREVDDWLEAEAEIDALLDRE